jgi:SEC-C motif-containing protein
MKPGRNQLCACGSGLKFKKCCLTRQLPANSSGVNPDLIIPANVIDNVLKSVFSSPEVVRPLENLADSQPDLCAFITQLSSSLPPSASFQAALSAFAIIWMFEQYHHRPLPRIGATSIQRSLDGCARSFFDFDNPRDATMSAKNQPHVHKFIADTIFDFDEGELDGFELFTLFVMLKTTMDVLHDSTSTPALPDSSFVVSTAAG